MGAVGAVGLGGLGACNGGGSTSLDMSTGGADLGPSAETCTTDGNPVMITGRYGIRADLQVNVKEPADCDSDSCIVDDQRNFPSQLLLLADLTQQGSSVAIHVQPCAIKIPEVAPKAQGSDPTVLTAPDSLVQSVNMVNATGTLSSANTCADIGSQPLAIVIGARLMDPVNDPLPKFSGSVALCGGSASTTCTAATDYGCICDQDGDGEPGGTVTASGLPGVSVDKIYLALRAVVALQGQVYPGKAGQAHPGQRLLGKVMNLQMEQSPVGCHTSDGGGMDCNGSTVGAVAALNPQISQSTTADSTFVGMPVPAGETCAQLVAEKDTLFQ